jgi:hypothetical protein
VRDEEMPSPSNSMEMKLFNDGKLSLFAKHKSVNVACHFGLRFLD